MSEDFSYMPAYKLREKLRNQKISAEELKRFFFKRIEKFDHKLHAFLFVSEDNTFSKTPGPLYGVPVVISDILNMKGTPTTYGSVLLKDHIPDEDEAEISLLKDAGAVIIGKTNVGEFCLSTETSNQLMDSTVNPWNPQYSPGGPNGGAAVAVTAGFAPIAITTDTGGALRMSASFCGLPGLVPSRGRIPIVKKHRVPYSELKYTRKGIIARSCHDIALMLNILARPDCRDPHCHHTQEDYEKAIQEPSRPLKIAWQHNFHFLPVDTEVTATMEQAAKKLTKLGHHVEEFQVGINPDYFPHFRNIVATDRYLMIMGVLEKHPDVYQDLMEGTKHVLELGDNVTGVQYSLALVYERWLKGVVDKIFHDYDLFLLPTIPTPPYLLDQCPKTINGEEIDPELGVWGLTLPFSMTGHPTLTLPAGFSKAGLPIGCQLVGPTFSEGTLLKTGYDYEQANPSLFDYEQASPS